jgi:hypothetical protein
MSMNPQAMQQMLAMYKQQFPQGQPAPALPPASPVGYEGQQPGLTSAPSSPVGGETNKLLAALMKAQQQKQIQSQLDAAKNSGQVQGPAQSSIPAMYPTPGQASAPPPGTLANPQGF